MKTYTHINSKSDGGNNMSYTFSHNNSNIDLTKKGTKTMKNTFTKIASVIALAAICLTGGARLAFAGASTTTATVAENAIEYRSEHAATALKKEEVKTVHVSYYSSVKTTLPKSFTAVVGSRYKVIEAPGNVSGLTFKGWYLNGSLVNNTSIVSSEENQVLVAKWVVNRTGKVIFSAPEA